MENFQVEVLVPGPVPVSPEVLSAMSHPVPVHYGPGYVPFYKALIGKLQKVFFTTNPVFPFGGSGSAAVDAALGTLMGLDKHAAVIVNGFFAERLTTMARGYDPDALEIRLEWGKVPDPADIAKFLDKNRVDVLAVVQSETSSGVLNPIKELAAVARERGVALMVDGVGSVGGVPLKMDEWGVAASATASQKCLESAPGLGIATLSDIGWKVVDSQKRPTPGWYLNLRNWRAYWSENPDWHPYPVTVATNNLMALDQSVNRVLAEGLEARYERHRRVTSHVRSLLRERGFTLLAEDGWASTTVTVAFPPADIGAADLANTLRTEYGMFIGGGLEHLSGKAIRVGHLGPSANEFVQNRLFAAIDAVMAKMRAKAPQTAAHR
ncbi:MAG TPA: alanine--glyoxylate aminotransferase family protein [Ktedonobacterales bacterium]